MNHRNTEDPYKILGINRDATKSQIKEAFSKKARIHHPDFGGNPVQFQIIFDAYNKIKNEQNIPNYNLKNNTQKTTPKRSFFETINNPKNKREVLLSNTVLYSTIIILFILSIPFSIFLAEKLGLE